MKKNKKDKKTEKQILFATRVPEGIETAVARVCVDYRGKTKQEIVTDALREYLIKHYKKIYEEYNVS